MGDIWAFLLQTLTVSGVAALLLVVKAMFRDKLSPRWQFAAWGILGLVLLIPAGLGGRYTLLNWPCYVEVLRSTLTGEYGALARVAAPIPLPPASLPRSAADWLFLLYELGVLFFLGRYIVSYVRLRLALRRGKPAENEAVRAAAERYHLPACPAVEAEGLPTAFICGVFKPVLALPAEQKPDEKVILHELLHLKYRDAAWGLVICFFRCLHWCNLLLWLCADLAGNDLEALCDQRVLERLEGEDRREYGCILLSMADEKYARVPGTSSMANGGKNIRRRIEAIVRFKRYPKGMGLVSVCIILLLTVPLIIGAKAAVPEPKPVTSVTMAAARTTYCTTCAGALDTYAKAVLTGRIDYRAMCAPLSEQDDLAGRCETQGSWRWMDSGLADRIDVSSGYKIYNLAPVGKDAYDGLLVLELYRAPEGEASGEANPQLAIQPVQAEKESGRWVVRPLEEFQVVGKWNSMHNTYNENLSGQIYEAQAGDFTLQLWRLSVSYVDSCTQSGGWFSSYSNFDTTPQPDGTLLSFCSADLYAFYTGDPASKGEYTHIAVSCAPLWKGGSWVGSSFSTPPFSRNRDIDSSGSNSSGSSSDGRFWGRRTLEGDWESPLFLCGMDCEITEDLNYLNSYEVELTLNGNKSDTLTLMPNGRDVFYEN